jgi:endonuclease-8
VPEGPEIRRAADRVAAAVLGPPLGEVYFAFDHLKPYEAALTGQRVRAVEPRGKALLIHFENDLSIYSHNQLYGVWMVRSRGPLPNTKRQLRLALHGDRQSALLYSASDIQVLTPAEILTHPFLKKLGPDLLDPATTPEAVVAILRSDRAKRRRLGAILLDQHLLCGLGNYLRSEALFIAGLRPDARPLDCTDEQLHNLAIAAIALTRQSYHHNGITNDLAIAQALKAAGQPRAAYRHWVFDRDGQPCHRCGQPITKLIAAGRRCYRCPTCQP